jgi:pimeloyl-ACP methyl ester carboxylesterase
MLSLSEHGGGAWERAGHEKGWGSSLCIFSLSIEKVSKITSPVLIIHGTEDEVIDFSHGLALYERCPKAVEPLWVEGAGHNDIELYSQYLERLRRFISQELPSQRA